MKIDCGKNLDLFHETNLIQTLFEILLIEIFVFAALNWVQRIVFDGRT